LHLRPDAVRLERITDPKNDPVDWEDPHLDFSRYTTTGVIGDPTEATAELGARLWEEVIVSATRTFREITTS
jgi:creatinine amidohydrolase